MSAAESEMLPIITRDAHGSTVYLCGVCKKLWGFKSLACFCAATDVALIESVPVLR